MKLKLLEKEIKVILINYLIKQSLISDDDVVINEFTIDLHARRIDFLVIKKNLTIAFEIKSEFDSLTRFEGQVHKYKEHFDKVIVIAASKHIQKLKSITEADIGLWEITSAGEIRIHRKGRIKRVTNKKNLLKLIPLNTLYKSYTKENKTKVEKNREFIEELISKNPIKYIRKLVHETILEKYIKYSNQFLNNHKIRKLEIHDLDILSPYQEKREIKKIKKSNKENSLRKLKEIYSKS